MDQMVRLRAFYHGKRVLITGHTGFKGSWLTKVLTMFGATVYGYSLAPATEPDLFSLCDFDGRLVSHIGDIRDRKEFMNFYAEAQPEIVFHLAAQPIVRTSYEDPAYTYETNVMGTVNMLEAVRTIPCARSVLNITTDKVYENREWVWGYREDDPLDGYDPYSNSKSCSELVTHSYKKSFFDGSEKLPAVSTARAGNVIGGGDFSRDRIIPDCVRAAYAHQPMVVRNPDSIRPYQHVLEPLSVYLMIAWRQWEDKSLANYYNVGPEDKDCISTGALVDMFCNAWGNGLTWENHSDGGPHEANFLKLDCSRIKSTFGWRPIWGIEQAIGKTVEWSKAYEESKTIDVVMQQQIQQFFGGETDV